MLLQRDDELLPDAQSLIDNVQIPEESQAYFYLMGIDAAPDMEPIDVGRKKYELYVQAENKFLDDGNIEDHLDTLKLIYSPLESSLPDPKEPLWCDLEEKSCAELLFDRSNNLDELLQNNSVLLKRYEVFSQLDDYATLTRPSHFDLMPPFGNIVNANRLKILAGIQAAKSSDRGFAMRILVENIANLRHHLAQQDTLIGKMVFLNLISENIDYAYLVSDYLGIKNLFQISPLNGLEMNYKQVFSREFSILTNSITTEAQALASDQFIVNKPAWLSRLMIKPNMTTNTLLPIYLEGIHNATLSHVEFAKKLNSKQGPEIRKSWIRNPAGTFLNQTITHDVFNNYIVRSFDLGAKILLFNASMKIEEATTLAGSLPNPYFEDDQTAYLSDDKRHLCFDGPPTPRENFRCLRIKM